MATRRSAAQIAASKRNLEKARAARSRKAKGTSSTSSLSSKVKFKKTMFGYEASLNGKDLGSLEAHSLTDFSGPSRKSLYFVKKGRNKKYDMTLDQAKKYLIGLNTPKRRRRTTKKK